MKMPFDPKHPKAAALIRADLMEAGPAVAEASKTTSTEAPKTSSTASSSSPAPSARSPKDPQAA